MKDLRAKFEGQQEVAVGFNVAAAFIFNHRILRDRLREESNRVINDVNLIGHDPSYIKPGRLQNKTDNLV